MPNVEERDAVDKKGDAAQAGCQTVETVYKIDGIDNKDTGENR